MEYLPCHTLNVPHLKFLPQSWKLKPRSVLSPDLGSLPSTASLSVHSHGGNVKRHDRGHKEGSGQLQKMVKL